MTPSFSFPAIHAKPARRLPRIASWAAACILLVCQAPASGAADNDLDALERAAFAAAVQRAAPSVVRIETIGGRERVGQMLVGTGATTGLVVDSEGYIVSSAFNFLNQPTSILVRLADGTRKSATLVATDRSRMIVLLKIEAANPLPVCEMAPRKEMRVGQWAIAIGRAFDSDRPSMAVGILSALDRIWGKALQTDAAVSPNNYGGPLIDIHGRVLGLLVPLSPDAVGEVAGVEWYDSGIGFAIPGEHIQQVLPRLKKGENLAPGMAGISLKGPNLFTGEPIIAACRPKSPASAAGIQIGDRIVEIEGRKIARAAEVKEEIGRRYADDKMHVVVLRNQDRVAMDIALVAELDPYQHGFLGVLPMRGAAESGVVVRYVYAESPAAKAGILPGDMLVSAAGEEVGDRLELRDRIGAHEPGEEVELEYRRGEALHKVKVVLAPLPEGLPPPELPPAHGKRVLAADKQPAAVGPMAMKIPEFANEAWGYVPKSCQEGAPQGIVMWLHGSGGFDWPKLLASWQPLCDRHDLILIAPKAAEAEKWMPGEMGLVDRLLAEVSGKYLIDPARVIVSGQESGGALAFLAAHRNREAVRAVAAVDAMPAGAMPENEPPYRLAVYSAIASKSRWVRPIETANAAMRKMKIPVTVKSLGETPRAMNPEELAELARWIDMLDRI